jgi:cysteine desulfurase / selenocysteine lyase
MSGPTIYFDNAATSCPKPEAVHARLGSFLREHGANPGRGSYRMVQEAEAVVSSARRRLAAFFNAPDPTRVIFALNATDALNMALFGSLKRGDHVITTVADHNSIVRPLNRMERDGLVTLSRVRPDGHGVVDPAVIAAAFTPRTRMVAMLHGSNVSGALQPIAEIGRIVRERRALFLVDAAQTAGLWPIDVTAMSIDLLALPGHKSLLGPAGTGALILGGGIDLDPWRTGGTGGDSSNPLQPGEYPHHLEAGTLNTPGIAAMMEGVRYVEERGIDAIRAHELSLVRRLAEGLGDHRKVKFYGPPPAAPRASVLCFNVAGHEPDEIASILDASFGIAVRSGLHCAPGAHRELGTFPAGAVRVSPGPFNTAEEIDRLVEAVRVIAV